MAVEVRSGVKVEVAVLGSQTVTVLMVSVSSDLLIVVTVLMVSVSSDVLIVVRCLISLMREKI